MQMPGKVGLAILACVLLVSGCTGRVTQGLTDNTGRPCHIIYDAGSKGTRLYIYEQSESGWIRHGGPKAAALADPVRAIRGKTMADAETVVNEIVNLLEQIRQAGPVSSKVEPGWPAFDWRSVCSVRSASVLATAGMRLAEQQDPEDSRFVWRMLGKRLRQEAGVDVTARTLSGFEEGLYAWMAILQEQPDMNFGMAEMGGGSVQVAFPCPTCEMSRTVTIAGEKTAIYSYSFTGWGQDAAWARFGGSTACQLGAAQKMQDWKVSDCDAGMPEFRRSSEETRKRINLARPGRWFLGGAFRYMRGDDINSYCVLGDDTGYEPASACFRAIFLQELLESLGLPPDSKRSDADWTLGAVICTVTRCLETD